MRLNRLLFATAIATVGLTAAAVAEPARESTLSAAAPVFTWEATGTATGTDAGNPFQLAGQECNDAGFPCDDTLLKVDELGTLEIISDADDGVDANTRPDMDLYLYESNAAGEPGKLIKASETPNPDEKLTQKVTKTGYYLVRNKFFSGVQVTYKGTATLKPGAATPPPSTGGTTNPGTGTTPGTSTTPAPAALSVAVSFGGTKLSQVLKTGFPVKVSCSSACKGSFTIALSKGDAKKLKLKGALGKASFDHTGDKILAVKVSKSVAKKLKKAKKAGVELKGSATDASGGQPTTLAVKSSFKK
jgi:hypothetical protein